MAHDGQGLVVPLRGLVRTNHTARDRHSKPGEGYQPPCTLAYN